MVFCCIAIVGAAIMYWTFLSFRQLLAGPRKDLSVSKLPVPPRALTGNTPQPVWGHTSMFQKHGGDIALFFPPDWREWKFLPKSWSRPLGDCFSIFIWGQWRVVIKGRERVNLILESRGLKEGWAWSPPLTLLGKSCLSLMPDDEADFLQTLLVNPLSHHSLLWRATQFAEVAEKFVDDLFEGRFDSKKHGSSQGDAMREHFDEFHDDDLMESCGIAQSSTSNRCVETASWHHRIRFDSLRSYTFDLINGPVLGLNKFTGTTSPSKRARTSENSSDNLVASNSRERENLFLWMDRLKRALCDIKISMGREWMYIWLLSEYGRAINGRMHLEEVISEHVEARAEETTVKHATGQLYHDPFVMPIPILTMTENFLNRHQTVTGEPLPVGNRPRSFSEPNGLGCFMDDQFSENLKFPNDSDMLKRTLIDDDAEQNCGRSHSSDNCSRETGKDDDSGQCNGHTHSSVNVQPSENRHMKPVLSLKTVSFDDRVRCGRGRANSSPDILLSEVAPKRSTNSRLSKDCLTINADLPKTILDHMLQQHDANGNGLTKAVTTELCILIWMMMDAGNAWTAMVLNLLSLDQNACNRVQQESDHLMSIHGKDAMFTPSVLNRMTALDAVLHEAIRLCPPFLGGMKVTSETIEITECGLQIPKGTNVVFCQPTDEPFDLIKAMGKKPEELGYSHPCPELFGFLPFKGLEVPLMVLQSKVFVAVLLQRCSPFLSKKRTFIRRVKEVFSNKSKPNNLDDSSSSDDELMDSLSIQAVNSCLSKETSKETVISKLVSLSSVHSETTQTEAMKLFTKVPFPEPRRVINVRERNSALERLGATQPDCYHDYRRDL